MSSLDSLSLCCLPSSRAGCPSPGPRPVRALRRGPAACLLRLALARWGPRWRGGGRAPGGAGRAPGGAARGVRAAHGVGASNSNFGLGRVSGLPIAGDLAQVVILLPSGGSDDQPLTLRGAPGRSPPTGRAMARRS